MPAAHTYGTLFKSENLSLQLEPKAQEYYSSIHQFIMSHASWIFLNDHEVQPRILNIFPRFIPHTTATYDNRNICFSFRCTSLRSSNCVNIVRYSIVRVACSRDRCEGIILSSIYVQYLAGRGLSRIVVTILDVALRWSSGCPQQVAECLFAHSRNLHAFFAHLLGWMFVSGYMCVSASRRHACKTRQQSNALDISRSGYTRAPTHYRRSKIRRQWRSHRPIHQFPTSRSLPARRTVTKCSRPLPGKSGMMTCSTQRGTSTTSKRIAQLPSSRPRLLRLETSMRQKYFSPSSGMCFALPGSF